MSDSPRSHFLSHDDKSPRPSAQARRLGTVATIGVAAFLFATGCGKQPRAAKSVSAPRESSNAWQSPQGASENSLNASAGSSSVPNVSAERLALHDATSEPMADLARVRLVPTDQQLRAELAADRACAQCHAEIVQSFQSHSMGNSLATPIIPALGVPEPGNRSSVIASFDAQGYHYEVLHNDGQVSHAQTRIGAAQARVAPMVEPVAFRVGTGGRGQSFLIDHAGYLFMSPITFYPQKQQWALSPGFEKNNSQFNRPVTPACLFCHANRALHDTDSLNHYRAPVFAGQAISCQRCHGAGSEHIRFHGGTWADTDADSKPDDEFQASGFVAPTPMTNVDLEVAAPHIDAQAEAAQDPIINPAKLPHTLREAVCQQCHLSGIVRVPRYGRTWHDFLPGKELDEAFAVFVRRSPSGDDHEDFVGQVEQMQASRCFQASNGQLGCISCHDPHALPSGEARVDYYRDRCLQCHEQRPCTIASHEREAQSNNCIACHMPAQATEVQHAATSDHRIVRTRQRRSAAPAPNATSVADSGRPLVRFGTGKGVRSRPVSAEDDRDYAVAILMSADAQSSLIRPQHLKEAQEILAAWVETHRDDIDGCEALAQALARTGDSAEALGVLSDILERIPKREFATVTAAELLSQSRQTTQAAAMWERAVQLNPWMTRYWYQSAAAQAQLGNWSKCQAIAQEAVKRFPTSVGARHLLIESLLQQRKSEEASYAFRELESLQPPGLDKLQSWFQQHPANR